MQYICPNLFQTKETSWRPWQHESYVQPQAPSKSTDIRVFPKVDHSARIVLDQLLN